MNLSKHFPTDVAGVAGYLDGVVRSATADPLECRVCWEFLQDSCVAAKLRLAADPHQEMLIRAALRASIAYLAESNPQSEHGFTMAWTSTPRGDVRRQGDITDPNSLPGRPLLIRHKLPCAYLRVAISLHYDL